MGSIGRSSSPIPSSAAGVGGKTSSASTAAASTAALGEAAARSEESSQRARLGMGASATAESNARSSSEIHARRAMTDGLDSGIDRQRVPRQGNFRTRFYSYPTKDLWYCTYECRKEELKKTQKYKKTRRSGAVGMRRAALDATPAATTPTAAAQAAETAAAAPAALATAPATAPASSLFGDLGALTSGLSGIGKMVGSLAPTLSSSVSARIAESVSHFNTEAERYCTEEGRAKEHARLTQLQKQLLGTVQLREGGLREGDASVGGRAETTLWAEAPPHLRDQLQDAVANLSLSQLNFLSPPQLPPPNDESTVEGELGILYGSVSAMLASDADLGRMRFTLVPARISEAAFWKNYLLRVLRERRILLLPILSRPIETPPRLTHPTAATASTASAVEASLKKPSRAACAGHIGGTAGGTVGGTAGGTADGTVGGTVAKMRRELLEAEQEADALLAAAALSPQASILSRHSHGALSGLGAAVEIRAPLSTGAHALATVLTPAQAPPMPQIANSTEADGYGSTATPVAVPLTAEALARLALDEH